MGTRFVASQEAFLRREYKERVVQSRAEDTVYGELFNVWWPDAPHRTLRNKVIREWEAAGRPPSGQRPGEGTIIGKITSAWAGESCSLVNDIKPAGQIVRDIVREAEAVIAGLNDLRTFGGRGGI